MPSGSKHGKEAKRRVVAEGLIKGEKKSAIAQKAGCSLRHAQDIAAEPATQVLVTQLLAPYRVRMRRLVPKVLNAIEKALVARTTDKSDHPARLRAVGRAAQLLEMAQGGKVETRTDDGAGLVTWEEFQVLYRRRVGETADAP